MLRRLARPPSNREDAVRAKRQALTPVEQITPAILVLRGQKVLVDTELASLYGVSTKRFNEQVRRNRERFPADFMFQLSAEELASLRSQIATLETGRGRHRKYLPYAFTEHDRTIGAILAAIRELMHPTPPKRRPIGFTADLEKKS
jgi:ORF6N domain